MSSDNKFKALADFWRTFSKVRMGIAGLVLLGIFVVLGIIGPLLVPFPDALSHWRDINYWQDNPVASPPAWTNWFNPRPGASSQVLTAPKIKQEEYPGDGSLVKVDYTFSYPFSATSGPRDVVFRIAGDGQVPILIDFRRPDGGAIEVYRDQLSLSKSQLFRVSLNYNSQAAAVELVRNENPDAAADLNPATIRPAQILFSDVRKHTVQENVALKGDYTFVVSLLLAKESIRTTEVSVGISGYVSGFMGTDISKRDIFTGVIIGIRWALILGLLTSMLTVLVGVTFAIVAAYVGGAIDWFLNRLYELVYLMPVLPFLIVTSAIFKPSIWTLIIMICLFFWSGVFKPVYSMALQIKQEVFIEASRALGASKARIIFSHIFPILLPYSFASMALSVPAIIVYEASVSLLGLGDATIVTWGQILHDAFVQGAVINNMWWWVVPPGLMIALMGATFAFLGTALDKILHPKLKTR